MKKEQEPFFEQGLLDLSVELSTKDITAGNEFAIFVLVKNPFSKPVWVREVNVSLPSELKIVEDDRVKELSESKKEQTENADKKNTELKSEISALKDSLDELAKKVQEKNNEELNASFRRISFDFDVLNSEIRAKSSHINLTMENDVEINKLKLAVHQANIEIGREKNPDGKKIKIGSLEVVEPSIYNSQTAQVHTIKLKSSLSDGVALQPGSTAVYIAVLNVKQSVVFTPSKYRLLFYVNYAFNSKEEDEEKDSAVKIFASTVAHEVAIRPRIVSVMYGAVLGGVAGSIVKILQNTSGFDMVSSGVSILLSTILSSIAVVFMVRKSDSQSLVSIEDFWGGVLIGFLVGYSGITFFESLAGISNS